MTYVPNTILAHPDLVAEMRRRNTTGGADIRPCPDVAENRAVVVDRHGRVLELFRWIEGSGWHPDSPMSDDTLGGA